MSYQGRSPINDVVRSVMSAAMLSPAMLAACSTQKNNPPPTTDPTPTASASETAAIPTATTTPTASASATTTATATVATATATATASAPDVMVHPSTRPRGNGKNMPTRGFAGAVRARR